MSDVETHEAQGSAAPPDGAAEQATTDDPVSEAVELVLDETPSLTPEQLTRQAQEAVDRVLDVSKQLNATLERPVFSWRSFLNDCLMQRGAVLSSRNTAGPSPEGHRDVAKWRRR
jgi:hypothetical protein